MGKDLYYTIPRFFEQWMAEHSNVADFQQLHNDSEFIYEIHRKSFGDMIRVWLAGQYHFTDVDFYSRPAELVSGDYILVARPESGANVSQNLIEQFKIGVGVSSASLWGL